MGITLLKGTGNIMFSRRDIIDAIAVAILGASCCAGFLTIVAAIGTINGGI